jgi:hypothetical protein
MSYDLWISCFCFQTCRMCMKDELVDLPVLGSHEACIMHIFMTFELIMHYLWCLNLLCTICGLGACIMHYLSCLNLLWSFYYALCTICAHMWYYGGYIVVCYCLQLLYGYLYLNCRDSSKYRTKCEKIGALPCASTRQRNHMSSAVCWHTANMPRVNNLCSPSCWSAANLGCPAHGIEDAHGKMLRHGTRQKRAHGKLGTAHVNGEHMAKMCRLTANPKPTANCHLNF